jgi:hypothetical protein
MHGDEARFVEVNRKTRRGGKIIEDPLQVTDRRGVGLTEDESVVSVLEHGARQISGERVAHKTVHPSFVDHALEHISHNDKEVRGKRVALPQTVTAVDPIARNAIEEHSGVPRGEDGIHPCAPALVEPSGVEDVKKTRPINRVEGFLEIDFEDNRRSFFEMAATKEVSRVDNVFRDASPREETRLVGIDERVNGGLQASSKDFRDRLHDAVLERDRTELGRVVSRVSFWEKDEEGPINTGKIQGTTVEGGKNLINIRGNKIPESGEKRWTKTVWPRARAFVHECKGASDFLVGERGAKAIGQGGKVGIELREVDTPGARRDGT